MPLPKKSENILKKNKSLFSGVQGNILKPHGRSHVGCVLLYFDKIDHLQVRKSLGQIEPTSTWQQIQDGFKYSEWKDAMKKREERSFSKNKPKLTNSPKSQPVIGCYITYEGYRVLKLSDEWSDKKCTAFKEGMEQRPLNDPPKEEWDFPFAKSVHGMILIADDDLKKVEKLIENYKSKLEPYIKMSKIQYGTKLTNNHGKVIEHFGYIDGISQPQFKEIPSNKNIKERSTNFWNPEASLDLVLYNDPLVTEKNNMGSFLVYRKLEQNVKGFKEAEHKLAENLGFTGEDEEIAGALIVGRFENGLPIIKFGSTTSVDEPSTENNFNYDHDANGQRCPFHAHIRKTNPRGDSKRAFGISDKEEKSHRIMRVGITYDEVGRNNDLEYHPERGVGLLFMCTQKNIENQFEFIQRSWANNNDFPKPFTGIDPVIGQGENRIKPNGKPTEQKWKDIDDEQCPASFSSFVTMKGGEYFFAPSLAFFKTLNEPKLS